MGGGVGAGGLILWYKRVLVICMGRFQASLSLKLQSEPEAAKPSSALTAAFQNPCMLGLGRPRWKLRLWPREGPASETRTRWC